MALYRIMKIRLVLLESGPGKLKSKFYGMARHQGKMKVIETTSTSKINLIL